MLMVPFPMEKNAGEHKIEVLNYNFFGNNGNVYCTTVITQ